MQCLSHAINSTKHAKTKAQEFIFFFWLSLNLCAKPELARYAQTIKFQLQRRYWA